MGPSTDARPGRSSPQAFPDTSVLYPVSILDLLMSLAESLVHQFVLSEELLAELARTWDEGRGAGKRVPTVGAADAALRVSMRHFLAPSSPGRTTKRRSQRCRAPTRTSAAQRCCRDRRGLPHRAGRFPSEALAELGVVVQSADEYLADLARAYPADVAAVVRHMAAERAGKIEGLTTATLAERWRAAGLTAFHAALVDALNA